MRILHCIPTMGGGGAERQLALIARAQQRAGDKIHVVFVREGPEQRRLEGSGVSIHRMSAAGNHDIRLVRQLYALIRDIRPEIVQTWLPQMDVFAGLACLIGRIPWVISERSSANAYLPSLVNRFVRPAIGRFADAVVANSSGGSELWARYLGPDKPICIVRNALPFDDIRNASTANLSQFGVPDDARVVLYVGRLAPEKNIAGLMRVAEQLARRTDAVVLICGDGPMRSDVESRIRELDLTERIKVLGYRTDVPSLMKAARVFISVSFFEGQPNAVLEAMACGCPMVLSDIPAHREFLDESLAALIPIDDADMATTRVMEAIQGSPLVDSRVSAALELSAKWTPDATVEAYRTLYQGVIDRHAGSFDSVL